MHSRVLYIFKRRRGPTNVAWSGENFLPRPLPLAGPVYGRILRAAADRFVLHGESMSCRHRDAVLGDEEARDGAHVGGASALQLGRHSGECRTTRQLLRRVARLHRSPRPSRPTTSSGAVGPILLPASTTQTTTAAATASPGSSDAQNINSTVTKFN